MLGHLTLWVDSGTIAAAAEADARLAVLVFLSLSAAMVVSAVFALRATVMAPLARLNGAIRKAAKVPVNPRPRDEPGPSHHRLQPHARPHPGAQCRNGGRPCPGGGGGAGEVALPGHHEP
ncbi:MAG: hypothetical protein NVV74_25815 [Magnetospirillum sp.]|nr:hypothetical protein [Magnetospirillum sp.]